MQLYPVNLQIAGRRVLVAGGGKVALRKVERLLALGAKVRLVAPSILPEIRALGKRAGEPAGLELIERRCECDDLDGALLVFACTNDDEANRFIVGRARQAGLLAQSATDPDDSDFAIPSEIRRGDFLLTISTGGASPALSQSIRKRLEEIFPENYAGFISVLAKVREKQLAVSKDSGGNAARFHALLESGIEKALISGDRQTANRILKEVLGAGFSLEELGA